MRLALLGLEGSLGRLGDVHSSPSSFHWPTVLLACFTKVVGGKNNHSIMLFVKNNSVDGAKHRSDRIPL